MYKNLLDYVKASKKELNDLYLDMSNDYVKKALEICGFKGSKTECLAVLRRIVDLKTDPLLLEFKKHKFSDEKILKLRDDMYDYAVLMHEGIHRNLVLKINNEKLIGEFDTALINGVHKIGLVLNQIQKEWQHLVIDTNHKKFASMKDPYKFIKDNKLYQLTTRGEVCDRTYGVVMFGKNSAKLVPYAVAFDDISKLLSEFDNLISNLNSLAIDMDEKLYIEYFKSLKLAFAETQNENIISRWRDAEMAWMNVKSPLQVGHPLEYYEDKFTNAVALEWDIRLKEEIDFDADEFKSEVTKSFDKIYKNLNIDNAIMHSMVKSNIDKTQLYISTPMIYYGADMEGLFSAQVVPNDEFVSINSGKKIFAFIDHVYESAKSKPKMQLTYEIFEDDFLKYGENILKNDKQTWQNVYNVSTIGHEFGHLWFIDEDSESLMNKSGVFKFIEEYKATSGGLVNFFCNEKEELKFPILNELVRRSVSLMSLRDVESVRAYYCEGLIHLTLLFNSEVIKFNGEKLEVNLQNYEKFKDLTLKTYEDLAKVYSNKVDAKLFLDKFCEIKDSYYLPIDKKTKEFVVYYYKLYQEIGNSILEEIKE